MDGTSNTRFKYGTKLVVFALTGDFSSHDPQHTLRKNVSPRFSYSGRTNTRLFVEHDHVDRHKYTIGRPWWDPIGYPIGKHFNTSTKYFAVLPQFKSHSCRNSEFVPPGPKLPQSFCVNRNKNRPFSV